MKLDKTNCEVINVNLSRFRIIAEFFSGFIDCDNSCPAKDHCEYCKLNYNSEIATPTQECCVNALIKWATNNSD